MTLLTWNHACTVGVRAMDDQHAIILDTLNELRLALVHGPVHSLVHEDVNEIFDRLIQFTRMHFASEDRLLQNFGFPDLEKHREHHVRLLAQMQESALHAVHGEAPRMLPLLQFLKAWFEDHIETLDRDYGPWLNACGVF